MQYKILNKINHKISEVSFGCMSLQSTSAGNDILINRAIDEGITLFDTADLYEKGENERLLGTALKGRRKDIILSAKVGNRWRDDGSGWDWCPTKKHILTAVDESLKRLQTDYIDLYLLHGGTIDDPMDETIEAFERLQEQGKIVSYGLSSIRPNVIREYVARSGIVAVMTQYSLLDRRPEEETLSLLEQNNIGVLARGTVAGGLLAGKPAKEYLGLKIAETDAIVKKINAILPERNLGEKALRYVVDNCSVTTAVVGIRTTEQLTDTIAAANSTPLSHREREALQAIWQGNLYEAHR
ncbi:aldo/keto reductase [Flavobacterium salilacus subsp. salilacus]|uniref:aldo/keto reductase n=1 Tax=Flavobacterium TaxID=237 RepID=UPI001074F075|nr:MULTISPECIES: aldo/keto reductase [Flavobacterium]KAF2516257.1 aldo/keto reductase [Flavobacterium salilacus subsp. salilacus]MBE1613785.1 aldo/keto reductase [Flavobacterium sp. SaA2.13]